MLLLEFTFPPELQGQALTHTNPEPGTADTENGRIVHLLFLFFPLVFTYSNLSNHLYCLSFEQV